MKFKLCYIIGIICNFEEYWENIKNTTPCSIINSNRYDFLEFDIPLFSKIKKVTLYVAKSYNDQPQKVNITNLVYSNSRSIWNLLTKNEVYQQVNFTNSNEKLNVDKLKTNLQRITGLPKRMISSLLIMFNKIKTNKLFVKKYKHVKKYLKKYLNEHYIFIPDKISLMRTQSTPTFVFFIIIKTKNGKWKTQPYVFHFSDTRNAVTLMPINQVKKLFDNVQLLYADIMTKIEKQTSIYKMGSRILLS